MHIKQYFISHKEDIAKTFSNHCFIPHKAKVASIVALCKDSSIIRDILKKEDVG